MAFDTELLEKASIQLIDGDRGSNYPKQEHFKSSGHCLFLSAKNVTSNGFEFEERAFIDRERDALLRAGKLQRGDIVLTTRGTIGNVAYYGDDIPFDCIRINSGMIIVRADDTVWKRRFLYFLFSSSYIQEQIAMLTSGSAVPQLPARDLKKFKLPIISKNTQDAFDKVIGDFTEKSQLNRRINQTLEAMAQAIFKSWFVDFDPVKAKIAAIEQGKDPLRAAMRAISGKTDAELDQMPREHHDQLAATAALFPDEMEESELGEIPRGWKTTVLAELTTKIGSGATPRGGKEVYLDDGVALIRSQNVYDSEFVWDGLARISDDAAQQLKSVEVKPADVLLNITGASILRTCVAIPDVLPARVNQHVAIIRAKENIPPRFIHIHLLQRKTKDFLFGLNAGGSREAVTKAHIESTLIIRPTDAVLAAFQRMTHAIYLGSESLARQSKDFSELRDILLPKLLSGELSVTEAMAEA